MVTVKVGRYVEQEEWLEIGNLVERQRSCDPYKSTQLSIKGDYANIDVFIDDCGDIELL